jgi:hypothetical protein
MSFREITSGTALFRRVLHARAKSLEIVAVAKKADEYPT